MHGSRNYASSGIGTSPSASHRLRPSHAAGAVAVLKVNATASFGNNGQYPEGEL